jgi:hypothetical protein
MNEFEIPEDEDVIDDIDPSEDDLEDTEEDDVEGQDIVHEDLL